MRLKIAIAAVLGMLLGLAPLTGAVQAGATDTAKVRVFHSIAALPGPPATAGPAADVWVDGTKAITGLVYGGHVDTELTAGAHTIVVCQNPSTSIACAGSGVTLVASTVKSVAGGNDYTMVAGGLMVALPGSITQFTNDQTPTSLGMARFQLNNALPAPAGICIDGAQVTALTAPAGGQAFAEIAAGAHTFQVYSGACVGTASPITMPAGTAWIFSLSFTGDMQVLTVDQDRPESNPATSAFCTDVTTFGTASKALTSLLSPITVGDTSTYPSVASVNAAVDAVLKVIASGDVNVPPAIWPQWDLLTRGLRDLTIGLQLVGGDVSKLPADALLKIVAGVNSPVKDPYVEGATTTLTNWYISNCIAAPTPDPAAAAPKYTG